MPSRTSPGDCWRNTGDIWWLSSVLTEGIWVSSGQQEHVGRRKEVSDSANDDPETVGRHPCWQVAIWNRQVKVEAIASQSTDISRIKNIYRCRGHWFGRKIWSNHHRRRGGLQRCTGNDGAGEVGNSWGGPVIIFCFASCFEHLSGAFL